MTSVHVRAPAWAPNRWLVVTGVLVAAALAIMAAPRALAQSDGELQALQAEVRVLRAGQAAMQKQLAEIKQLLNRAARGRTETAFQPQQITVADAPYLGRPDAAVTLVEFTDYQCPFCRRHSAQTKPRLIKDYVATGKLRYVLREFPLARIHPQATKAAEAALCAGDQDKYWDLNAVFFANQRKLKPTNLLAYAEGLGLDMTRFGECLDDGKYAKRVQADLAAGAKAGVRGTPTFFLGLTDPADPGKFKASQVLRGAQPYTAFKQAIDQLLAQSDKSS